jgi:hypothetical protein
VTALVGLLALSCQRYWVCDEVSPAATAALPQQLSRTGLYENLATAELAPGVLRYTPQFALWSDGSEKERWISLPEGQRIDTSDQDEWVFPAGTKIWKQFSLAGARIETRLLEKRGPGDGDWDAISYIWNPDGKDATAAPLGAIDSHDTDHVVPAASECLACHGGRKSFVLGFSAIQLAAEAAPGQVALDDLIEQGLLTNPPETIPVVPGDAVVSAALGYFHGNCSHCHNQNRPERDGARCYDPRGDYDFTLAVAELDTTGTTATYRTVVGEAVKPGAPDDSKLYELMSERGMFRQMPPLATEHVDSLAVSNVRLWIEGL